MEQQLLLVWEEKTGFTRHFLFNMDDPLLPLVRKCSNCMLGLEEDEGTAFNLSKLSKSLLNRNNVDIVEHAGHLHIVEICYSGVAL